MARLEARRRRRQRGHDRRRAGGRVGEGILADLPVIQVDLAGAVPAYRQIADAVRAHLVAGRVRPGEQLPAVRRIAIDLGVNHNTVAEAYRLLAEEGWLDLGRGRGATVLARTAPGPGPEARARFERRVAELAAEARAAGLPARSVRQALLAVARSQREWRKR